MSANKITMTLDKAITLTNLGFTLNVVSGNAATISSVSGSGTNIIEFTISRDAIASDVFTLSYNSSIGDARGLSGIQLASFSGRSITNNVEISDWILATGDWNDSGFWRDDEVWID